MVMTLAAYLKQRSLRAADIVRASGVPAPDISRFLAGKMQLGPTKLRAIVNATKGAVTYDDLIREGERAALKRARAAKRSRPNHKRATSAPAEAA
jgi:DNA-binding transcriptional regulator YdaS (Cro superfamily)